MTPTRVLQPNGTPSSMAVHADPLAAAVAPQDLIDLPLNAQLFRAHNKVYVGGDGLLIQIDVTLPSHKWPRRTIPAGRFGIDPAADVPPFLVADNGIIHTLEPDGSLREAYKLGALARSAELRMLPGGGILICTMRTITGIYRVDAAGCTVWRIHRSDTMIAALAGAAFALRDGDTSMLVCFDTESGRKRWHYRAQDALAVSLVGIVDDTVWITNGMALIGLDHEDGSERARIDPGVYLNRPLLTPEGHAHMVFGALHHWIVDLRTGTVVRKNTYTETSGEPYAMHSVAGGDVIVRDRAYRIYRLGGSGTAAPVLLWSAPSLPIDALVHNGGLLVLTEPFGSRVPTTRSVHWLAPLQGPDIPG